MRVQSGLLMRCCCCAGAASGNQRLRRTSFWWWLKVDASTANPRHFWSSGNPSDTTNAANKDDVTDAADGSKKLIVTDESARERVSTRACWYGSPETLSNGCAVRWRMPP
jgi:hypothetical protein